MSFLLFPIRSTLASKYLMAVTGIGLVLFVLGHLAGNLLLFLGAEALNAYAKKMQELGPLLWAARVGLLITFVLHLLMGVRLSLVNQSARPLRYQYEDTRVATWASQYMLLTGVVVLLFLLYHLAHFTFGWIKAAPSQLDAHGHHDVYAMVIAGFRHPGIAALYLLALVGLWLHLWHGVSSLCQSLGLGTVQENRWIAWVGPVIATLVLLGNSAIVLAVLFRLIGPVEA